MYESMFAYLSIIAVSSYELNVNTNDFYQSHVDLADLVEDNEFKMYDTHGILRVQKSCLFLAPTRMPSKSIFYAE